jgi:hypothetical protein
MGNAYSEAPSNALGNGESMHMAKIWAMKLCVVTDFKEKDSMPGWNYICLLSCQNRGGRMSVQNIVLLNYKTMGFI